MCGVIGYPTVMIRADGVTVVTSAERLDLSMMVAEGRIYKRGGAEGRVDELGRLGLFLFLCLCLCRLCYCCG